jgi:hypothetical protein
MQKNEKQRDTVPTIVLVVLSHDGREILHTNMTESPKAVWTARQIIEADELREEPKYLVRDRDRKFSALRGENAWITRSFWVSDI